jgi:hypothetical protein
VNPISLAVSNVFKIEKRVSGGDIVLTSPAYMVAWPTIARAYHGFEEYGRIRLEGYRGYVKLFKLVLHDKDDAARIAVEQLD